MASSSIIPTGPGDSAGSENIDCLPQHVAIIMDGNNRWAKKKLMPGMSGHRAGIETIRKVLTVCDEYAIKALTLFAFSSENWQRPAREVQELMKLFKRYLNKEVSSLHDKGIRLRFIGRRDRLDQGIVSLMEQAENLTAENALRTLVLAVDYGGRWDMANAASRVAAEVAQGRLTVDAIDENLLGNYMALGDLPAPDLCIRTGAEQRISNFLLWQLAYAELYFSECYWPDFGETEMLRALQDYSARQRRFGKTTDQLNETSINANLTDSRSNA